MSEKRDETSGVPERKRTKYQPRTREESARDKALYLEALAKTGAPLRSVEAVPGLGWKTVDTWKAKDPKFVEEYRHAQAKFAERLEAELIRRGAVGVDEPVFYKGKQVATVKRYSDRLLEKALKKVDPGYRDHTSVDVNVRGGVLVVPGVAPSLTEWADTVNAEPAFLHPSQIKDEAADRG